MAHTYRTLAAAKVAVEALGVDIARGGLPRAFSPFIFAFTGDGNVSQGAQDIFSLLPHRMVRSADLAALAQSHGAFAPTTGPCVVLLNLAVYMR
jgi:alpha-aminoadipic semialdehyde synthase